MTASGMSDLAHGQGALLSGQMSWSPPFEDLMHSQRPPVGVGLRLQEVLDATSQYFPLHEGSGNSQRFPSSGSIKCRPVNLFEPTFALSKHKHLDQPLVAFLAKYVHSYVDVSCLRQPIRCSATPSTYMGRHSRNRIRDSSVSSRESRQRRQGVADMPRSPQQYRCSICKDRFSDMIELRRHEKTHRTRSHRDHHCPEPSCTLSFAYSKDLNRHMKTHQPTTPMTCPHCSKSYGRTDNLTRHIREKHPEHGKTISRKSSDIGGVESTIGSSEPLSSYVEVVTSAGDTEMDLDRNTSQDHELMHVDVSSFSEPTQDHQMTSDDPENLQLRQGQAMFTSQQGHEKDEIFRFRELSAVIRELNSRVEHMLSSTELPKPHSSVAEGEHLCALGDDSLVVSSEDRQEATLLGSRNISTSQLLREKQHNGGYQSCTGSPSSGPVSSSSPPATAEPGSSGRPRAMASRKRRAGSNLPYDGQGGGGDREGGFRPNGVRQKLNSGKTKDRLECIFAVGEPSTHPGVRPQFEYVSQLVRHLKTHDFYACVGCMIKFPSPEALESHGELHHINTCTRKACKREQLADTAPTLECRHLITSQDQWRELYALQYSTQNMAAVLPPEASNSHMSDTAPDMLDVDFDELLLPMDEYDIQSLPLSSTAPIESFGSSQSMAFSVASSLMNPGAPSSRVPLPLSSSPTFRRNGNAAQATFEREVQTLRERVQILEQRLSQPSEREQDLEMVLTNVWQALLRSGSAEAQTESGVWRLVRRFASNILSTATQANQGAVALSASRSSTVPEADWQHINLPQNRESSGLYMNGPV